MRISKTPAVGLIGLIAVSLAGCVSVGPVTCTGVGCAHVSSLKPAANPNPPVRLVAERMRAENNRRIRGLGPGMTRAQALQWMGTRTFSDPRSRFVVPNPLRTDSYQLDDQTNIEIAYYYTDLEKTDSIVSDKELTPLLFKNDVLTAWGRESVADWQIKNPIARK